MPYLFFLPTSFPDLLMSKLGEAFSVAVRGFYNENLLKLLEEERSLCQRIETEFSIGLHGVNFCLSRAVIAAL